MRFGYAIIIASDGGVALAYYSYASQIGTVNTITGVLDNSNTKILKISTSNYVEQRIILFGKSV
jgi:hypothetical protein